MVDAAACSSGPEVCSTIGCSDGLDVTIEGNLQASMNYEIDVSTDPSTPDGASIMHCTLTFNGGVEVKCDSALRHWESGGSIHFADRLPNVHVRVSTAMTTIAEKSFTPTYVTTEPNGPGCGTCSHAAVSLNVL